MSAKPKTPKERADKTAAAQAEPSPQTLRETCEAAWRVWDATAIRAACAAREPAPPNALGEVLMWQAMASFMCEGADALAYLDEAFEAHQAAGQEDAARGVVCRALVLALLDTGAMERVRDWLARWEAQRARTGDIGRITGVWERLASLAAVALGGAVQGWTESAALDLLIDLRRPRSVWSADDRLMAAQVLIEYQFTQQRYEAFDVLSNAVESPNVFNAASALMQSRWLYTYGQSQHHTARLERAERAWERGLKIASQCSLSPMALKLTLALARVYLVQGRMDEAETRIDSIEPQWGFGRTTQLMELLQLRARVQLLRGNAASALSLLEDAVKTAEAAGLPRAEYATCLADLSQTYVALGRITEATDLLERQAREQNGRDAIISRCQACLLAAHVKSYVDPDASHELLVEGLGLAQQGRYSMFFRLLPHVASAICDQALRCNLQVPFVLEVIRARDLPAPAEAGVEWPRPLWIRLMGAFELRHKGTTQISAGKVAQKPLELLRLLACQRSLTISLAVAMDALWPAADANAARKSFDVAVHRLRPLLGDASLLWVRDGRVGLDASRVGSDLCVRRRLIDRIEALAMASRQDQAGIASAASECLLLLDRVLKLTSGDLLPGMAATPWLLVEQRLCQSDTVRAALAAAAVLEQADAGQSEQKLLEAALRIEPLSETLVSRLMQAYERAARRGDALRVYENYRIRLVEAGVQPSQRLQTQWHDLLGSTESQRCS
jgi:DNA-binding SARP family transcriptional activator